ncbi:MAG: hypothetical protein AAGA15_01270 [Pseudomonadota bacterium]
MQRFDRRPNVGLDGARKRGRLQPMGAAQKQRIVKYIAQAAQSVADGGRGQTKLIGDKGRFSMAQDTKEDQKQSHIEAP